jgi:uncharacterized damage-inducible protein DinB
VQIDQSWFRLIKASPTLALAWGSVAERIHKCTSMIIFACLPMIAGRITSVSPPSVQLAPYLLTPGRMAHILSAQKLWLERIQESRQSMAVWPNLTIDECAALADEMSSAWQTYLTQLAMQVPPTSLNDKVEYRNSKGELWSSRVEDVLTHVLFHSAYHRGQIALQMRASGAQPAYTDFIHAVRQGFIE